MSNSVKKPLQIKDLSISRMPGFSDGMKPFKDFSEGINIIAGPNASGKSTTAHAIQKLIWQNDTARIKLGGHAALNGDRWTLRVDSGQKICQRNGVPDEISGVPAAEEQNRYMLALHTLMTADGKDLAKQIIRESVGGYDPEKAAQDLGYDSKVSTTGIGVYKDFERAEKSVRESQKAQKAVKAEEQKLSDLYNQKEDAEASEKKAAFYRAVIDAKRAEKKYLVLKTELDTFPSELDLAHGEELTRVKELEKEISSAEGNIRESEDIIGESQQEIARLTIPQSGVPMNVIDELEKRADRLEKAESELNSLEIEKEGLEKKRSESLKRIGNGADADSLRKIDLEDIADLDKFLEEAHRLASEKRLMEQEVKNLEEERGNDNPDPERVREGISQLSFWLKEATEKPEFPGWIILTIGVLAIISAVSGYFLPVAGAVGLAIILILAVYGWIQLGKTADDQTEQTRIQDFQNTGLTAPDNWSPDKVSARLDGLVSDLRAAQRDEKISYSLKSLQERLDRKNSAIKDIESKKRDLEERLSVLPELPFDNPESYSQLAWYITAVQTWQDADSDLLAVEQKLKEIKRQLKEELSRVSELVKPYSEAAPEDSAEAQAVWKKLKRQEEIRDRATTEIGRQKSSIEKHQNLIDKKNEARASVYKKFGLSTDEKNRLRQFMEQLDDFKTVRKKYDRAKGEFDTFKQTLEEHSLYDKEQSRLAELTIDEAETLQTKLVEEARELEPLRNRIAEIVAEVKTVKSGNSLEHALAERDQAVENLRDHYEENLQKITGRLLADTIKEEMREQNRPKVFKEASRLFNRITKGRYELRMDEKDEPEFIAFDTVENIGKNLDQLSSGTRIQLLMAVRLAFVETQETSIKLPILADELLANSDDVRAEAIIEALTEISREGRQVFYFTAQGDEVAKWDSYLKEKGGVNHKVYYLSGERAEKENVQARPLTRREPIRLIRDIAEPGLLNHTQYADVLNVSKFDLLTDDPEQLHLWYLIDDPGTLHAALSAGIDFWGSLKSYLEAGGVIEGLSDQTIKEMEEKTDLLERYLQLYRQGRPRPINRSVLEQSGAVSDSFIDAVSDKLKQLHGNPADLIVALRNSEVSGFRTNKMDELENYLLEEGYLDTREPLEQNSLTVALQAFISNLELSPEEAERFLERLTDL
ncbi:ATP-binding protein [Rhodohalobacter sp. 8-1]|uniref:ATP-binding protein n=1 Tax=Rhodohalobacter sp. 8-1 TaxID=3131972 RepID=UPI0030EBD3D9